MTLTFCYMAIGGGVWGLRVSVFILHRDVPCPGGQQRIARGHHPLQSAKSFHRRPAEQPPAGEKIEAQGLPESTQGPISNPRLLPAAPGPASGTLQQLQAQGGGVHSAQNPLAAGCAQWGKFQVLWDGSGAAQSTPHFRAPPPNTRFSSSSPYHPQQQPETGSPPFLKSPLPLASRPQAFSPPRATPIHLCLSGLRGP